jgi:hypothetical protein
MDMKYLEFLLRRTSFCRTVLSESWDILGGSERIELLLHLWAQDSGVPEDLPSKACTDPNPVIRMLAAKCSYVSEQEFPELYVKLMNDDSPLVRAAMKGGGLSVRRRDLEPLSHIERLGVIAMAEHIDEESFAEFIEESLKDHSLAEDEAVVLVIEFLRNPNVVRNIESEPLDGMDAYTIRQQFDAVWRLTTSTPPNVHRDLAWEYPLHLGGDLSGPTIPATIPAEMLNYMSKTALEALAYRQHELLLEKLKTSPEKFDEEIHHSAQYGAERDEATKANAPSEMAALREDLDALRAEIWKSMDALAQRIAEAASRRRGLFG